MMTCIDNMGDNDENEEFKMQIRNAHSKFTTWVTKMSRIDNFSDNNDAYS